MCFPTSLFAMFGWSGGELLIVLFLVLLLFGGAKLPSLARGLGQSVKEFKKASREDDDEKPAGGRSRKTCRDEETGQRCSHSRRELTPNRGATRSRLYNSSQPNVGRSPAAPPQYPDWRTRRLAPGRRSARLRWQMTFPRSLAWILGLMAFGAGLLAGCASAGAGSNPRVPESSSSALLRPGDTLTISLQGIRIQASTTSRSMTRVSSICRTSGMSRHRAWPRPSFRSASARPTSPATTIPRSMFR